MTNLNQTTPALDYWSQNNPNALNEIGYPSDPADDYWSQNEPNAIHTPKAQIEYKSVNLTIYYRKDAQISAWMLIDAHNHV